jgi:hypothetical protein
MRITTARIRLAFGLCALALAVAPVDLLWNVEKK